MAGTPAIVRYIAYIGVLGGPPPGGGLGDPPIRGRPEGHFSSHFTEAWRRRQNPYPGAPAASCECLAVSEASLRAGGPPERLERHHAAPGSHE